MGKSQPTMPVVGAVLPLTIAPQSELRSGTPLGPGPVPVARPCGFPQSREFTALNGLLIPPYITLVQHVYQMSKIEDGVSGCPLYPTIRFSSSIALPRLSCDPHVVVLRVPAPLWLPKQPLLYKLTSRWADGCRTFSRRTLRHFAQSANRTCTSVRIYRGSSHHGGALFFKIHKSGPPWHRATHKKAFEQ